MLQQHAELFTVSNRIWFKKLLFYYCLDPAHLRFGAFDSELE